MTLPEFIAASFCEVKPDGTVGKPSFARLSLGILLAFALGWVTAFVIWHRALPDLAGVIGLVTGYGTLVYTGGKAVGILRSNGSK